MLTDDVIYGMLMARSDGMPKSFTLASLRQEMCAVRDTMSNETCEHWQSLFSRINHYFRDDIVLNGTEHASKELGYAITAAYLVVIIFGACGNFLTIYVLVIFPTKRERQQNLSLMFFVFIWVVSLILAVPLLIASDLNTIYEDPSCGISLRICHEQNDIWQTMMISKQAYTLSVLATQYAFPLFSLVFAYTRIAHRMKLRFANRNMPFPNTLSQNQRRRSVVERQRRTHLLLMCVVAVFAIAWLPLNVFHMVNTFEWVSLFSVSTFAVCHVAAMCSACLNPLIYAFFNHNFRTEFIALFERLGLRKLRGVVFSWDEDRERKKSMERENKNRTNNGGNHTLLTTHVERLDESVALNPDTDEQL
ncbi:7 transmembrane receptor [Teladorsagia circumcincta]|uniref:7 transmembrane receptor n=1 Tax=Teladorsagia circumcincta TaxID=45464 RepID=A0A2G9V5G5_TELCI|nr:7 transmembrane receptor [Teladorsagia circumcincta]